jgi:squalene-associated FAD-dependent desaturase
MTVSHWLNAQKQPAEARRCFWEPLTVAIMNERAERASARLFLHALRQAFVQHRWNAALVFPRAGLSRLFADPARAVLERSGSEIRCNTTAARLAVSGGRVTGVVLSDGVLCGCSAVVLALPAPQSHTLTADMSIPGLRTMAEAPSSPIIGIHLWCDGALPDRPAVGLIGRRVQWVFRRDRHISLVISAARDLVDRSHEELTSIALEDLHAVFGASVGKPSRSVVIRERRATISLTPDIERVRPGARTTLPNLFLSGDWTDTGLPATIEGAILSGVRAATLAADSLRLNGEMGILD